MDNELLKALLNVQPGRLGTYPNEYWRALFNYYNSNKTPGDPHLGMSCQPCYDKVYAFCRQALLKELTVALNPPANDKAVSIEKWEANNAPPGGYTNLKTR